MSVGPRRLIETGLFLSDRGERLVSTPMLDDVLAWYESGAVNGIFCSARRQGKSTCAAALAVFELLAVPGAFVVWVAGSGDQASDVLQQKVRLPLERRRDGLGNLELGYSRQRVTNLKTGAVVQVLAPTEVTSTGRTISLLVFDEARGIDEEVVEVLRPSAANGRILATGSPGPPRGWWYRAVNEAGPADFVRHYRGADLNPTIDPAFVAAERERLARRGSWGALMSAREWDAQFCSIAEHPLVSGADVKHGSAAEVAPYDPARDVTVIGVDLSTHKDLTTSVVVAKRGELLRVIEVYLWDPKEFGRVQLALVAARLEAQWRRYKPRAIVIDRYQALSMTQDLARLGAPIEDVAVTARLNEEIFSALLECLVAGRLVWARNRRLEDELSNLELSETVSGGFRVTDSDKRLHRDLVFSLALAVWKIITAPENGMSITPCSRWGQTQLLPINAMTTDGKPWWRSSREILPEFKNRSQYQNR